MSVVRGQARRRWCLVAAGVALACAAPAVIGALPATASRIGPSQLRARILAAADRPYQGYAQSDAELGIPSFPALSDLTATLDGITRMRVWQASASVWRVDVLSDAGERDTYALPDQTFTWDSGTELLSQIAGTPTFRLPRAADLVPPALAWRLLRDSGQASRIFALPARRVAGIDAAGLRLVPADPATMIGRVDVWADPHSGLPLQVEVASRGAGPPALVTKFLQVSSARPPRQVLVPVRGPGTSSAVTSAEQVAGALQSIKPERLPGSLAGRARVPQVLGTDAIGAYGRGLSTFAVLPLSRHVGASAMRAAQRAGGALVTFPLGFGYSISTPLLTVTVAHSFNSNDTFMLAGLVDSKLLRAAAAELTARPDEDG